MPLAKTGYILTLMELVIERQILKTFHSMIDVLKPQVHDIAIASNRQVRVEIHRKFDSTTKTKLTVQFK